MFDVGVGLARSEGQAQQKYLSNRQQQLHLSETSFLLFCMKSRDAGMLSDLKKRAPISFLWIKAFKKWRTRGERTRWEGKFSKAYVG